MNMMLPCGWRWEAAWDLLLSLRGHTQCRQGEHPAHPVWARNTELSLERAPKHPKAGRLETIAVENDIFNCFQKECLLSAPKSIIQHLWASSRRVQPGYVFLPVCSQLGLNFYQWKAFLGSFWPFEKGPSPSASAARESWQRQTHLSALLWLTAKQIKGLKTSDRGFVVCGWQKWSQRQAFTCQIRSPCDAIKHYGFWRKNGGVVTCTDPLCLFSHRNGKDKTNFLIPILLNYSDDQNKALLLF